MSVATASLLRRCGGSVRRCYHGFRRSLATQTREIGSQRQQKQQLPWLLLSSPDNPESRYLYDLTGDDRKPIAFSRELHLPQIAGRHLVGSSQGYLFSIDPICNMDATDPFTGARLPVPSTSALPNMVGAVRDTNTGKLTHYVSNPYLLADPDPPFVYGKDNPYRLGGSVHASTGFNPREVQSFSVDHMSKIYFRRAILSPSLDTVAVVHRGLDASDSGGGDIALFLGPKKRAIGGGSSWTALRSPLHSFEDLIFHKGRLHAVDVRGILYVFDENLDNPSGRSRNAPSRLDGCDMLRSVVESPDGKDLFMVFRDLDVADYEYADYSPRTDCFKVYKFNEASRKWKRVKNIGDIALFLGPNHSMSLSASDYPGGIIKPNCIYFTDECCGGFRHPDQVGDTGVYSLKDGSFRFYELRDGSQQLHWPPPIWFFMPTAR